MNVWRVAMDESTGKVVGEPEAVTTGAVARAWQLSLSRDGRRIVYAAAVQTSNIMKANLNIAGTAVDGTAGVDHQGIHVFCGSRAVARRPVRCVHHRCHTAGHLRYPSRWNGHEAVDERYRQGSYGTMVAR